jgi:hypothetical protein
MDIREKYQELADKYNQLNEIQDADVLGNMIQFQYDVNHLFVEKIEELQKQKVE